MPTSVMKVVIGLNVVNGIQYSNKTFSGTVSNDDSTNDIGVVIGTTEETIAFTDIITNGVVLIENLDAVNYVRWGVASTDYAGRIPAGKADIVHLEPGKSLFMKANTAACRCRIIHVGSG